MDVTFIPLAVAGGAEIRPNAFVTRFERAKDGRITAVVYVEDEQERRQRCKHVFLCAGAVETPRLLLINDLANESGQVGHNLMAHVAPQVWGTFREEVRPYKGITGALISEDFYRRTHTDFAGGYIVQSIGIMPVTHATQVARGRGLWGQALRDYMRGYNHVAGINVLGECLPHQENHLTLSDELDSRGFPKPLTNFSYGRNEQALGDHAERLMREIWQAAGAEDLWTFPRSAHVIGTCRMGSSSDDAVVDPDGRSFSIPNLTISDNSTFPSALGVNPSLTIMALALRTADRFLAR